MAVRRAASRLLPRLLAQAASQALPAAAAEGRPLLAPVLSAARAFRASPASWDPPALLDKARSELDYERQNYAQPEVGVVQRAWARGGMCGMARGHGGGARPAWVPALRWLGRSSQRARVQSRRGGEGLSAPHTHTRCRAPTHPPAHPPAHAHHHGRSLAAGHPPPLPSPSPRVTRCSPSRAPMAMRRSAWTCSATTRRACRVGGGRRAGVPVRCHGRPRTPSERTSLTHIYWIARSTPTALPPPPLLQPEEEAYETEEGVLDVDVGVLFTVSVTKGDTCLA